MKQAYSEFKKLPFEKKVKYTLLMILFFIPVCIIIGAFQNAAVKERHNKKYKKVIKKGLLWDTEYLIERE